MKTEIQERKKNIADIANARQREASDPNFSVWVEASAGTGKTKVLTDRVLRLLLKGVNPSNILCLTYTKAAASVMKERIASKLSRWAVVSDDELESDIKSLNPDCYSNQKTFSEQCSFARKLFAEFLDSSDEIRIQTIHSFCQEILKRFPLEAKISPYFEVMDDRKSREILNKIKEDILVDDSDEQTFSSVCYLVENVSEYTFPDILLKITENRTKIEELLLKYPVFTDFKNDLALSLGVDTEKTKDDVVAEFIANTSKSFLAFAVEVLSHDKGKIDLKNCEFFRKILQYGFKETDIEEYQKIFLTDGEKKNNLAHAGAIAYNFNIIKAMEDEAARIIDFNDTIKKYDLFFSTLAVIKIASTLIKKYNQYKQQAAKMDYEDLILITKRLLSDKNRIDWVMYKLDEGIEHILVDEAQDNSPLQWDIIKSLSEEFFVGDGQKKRGRTIFAVGDRKQSIYSFQGADPQKFESMRKYFAQKAFNFKTVNLDVSFRSAQAVLDAVNSIFSDIKTKKGVVQDDKNIEHYAYNSDWYGKVEVWDMIEEEKPDLAKHTLEDYDFSKLTQESIFAKKLVKRIKEMVTAGTYLASKKRTATYKDFMVLVRNRNGRFLPEFLHECQNAGVPTEGSDQIKLLEQIAIQDLISLGKFLLLPTDDLSLAEVLKSPLFNLTDDDLIILCAERKKMSLWSSLSNFKEYKKIYECLQNLINSVDFMRPYELYNQILSKQGGRKKFIARLGGEAEDGIDEFMSLTISYEEEHIPSLQGFIQWITADDIKIKRELEQTENNAIKIMTVHGSKGLQSPIVILPDASTVSVRKHSFDILTDEMIYAPLSSQNYEEKCQKIYDQEQEKELEEYRRLLYVALTRAEDMLYVCVCRKKDNKIENSWWNACFEGVKRIGDYKDGISCYENGENFAECSNASEQRASDEKLPSVNWLFCDAKKEGSLAKPYRPSYGDEQESEVYASPIAGSQEYKYKRGLTIHKILQFIGDIKAENRKNKIEEFLQKIMPEKRKEDQNAICSEILSLVNDEKFSMLFSNNARTEVSIIGEVDGKIVSAQIDRLIVCDKKVIIIDYKTNRPAASDENSVPEIYKQQLRTYKKLLEIIYPDKEIETYILWTNTACLMKIK